MVIAESIIGKANISLVSRVLSSIVNFYFVRFNKPLIWHYAETPATAAEKISFTTMAVHEIDPAEIKITWNQYNLTSNLNAGIQISLWGYRETKTTPELKFIADLEVFFFRFLNMIICIGVLKVLTCQFKFQGSHTNTGSYIIRPANYRDKYNPDVQDIVFGFIKINLTDPTQYSGINLSP